MPTLTEIITAATDFVADYQVLIAGSFVLGIVAAFLRRVGSAGR